MKNFLFCLFASLIVVSTSCKKDDCEAGSLSDTIIGEWNVSLAGQDLGDVEFKGDGTLIDPDDVLIGGENGSGQPLNIKTYVLDGDESISTSASDGTNSVTVEYGVPAFSCDEVTIEVLGVEAEMRRK